MGAVVAARSCDSDGESAGTTNALSPKRCR